MSKKFTEEEYRNIVELHDKRDFSVDGILDVITYFVHNISRTGDADIDMALAISNPLTREWAHDQFVEKEKKYYWNTKKKNEYGHSMNLLHGAGGVVQMMGPKDALTESEIREWGYNPEMFNKEEVR